MDKKMKIIALIALLAYVISPVDLAPGKMKIIALIALLAYVISPVDLAPGPMDDMIMCLLYAIMNYKSIPEDVLDEKPES